MSRKLKIDDFIRKSQKSHGSKFDYSKVNFINTKTKVIITCPTHGRFLQTPSNHFRYGCKQCSSDIRDTRNRPQQASAFMKRAIKVHDNKYCYSKSIYKSVHEKIVITCPIHGDFSQTPNSHMRGRGCHSCKQGVNHPRFGKPCSSAGYYGVYCGNIFRSLSELFWMIDAQKNKTKFLALDQPDYRKKWQIYIVTPDGKPSTYCADFFLPQQNKVIDIKPEWRVHREAHKLKQGELGYMQKGYNFGIVNCDTINIDYDLLIRMYLGKEIKLFPAATKRIGKRMRKRKM